MFDAKISVKVNTGSDMGVNSASINSEVTKISVRTFFCN